jgi:hypothetical protein
LLVPVTPYHWVNTSLASGAKAADAVGVDVRQYNIIYNRLKLMNGTFSRWQEWLTVLAYVGFTVFIMWCVFATQKK